ncbi:fatty acid desaturase family protein [Herbidospora mongoliensis]|uniref:fatty acid desaturase family protein n=1 Tax=Herbidospora mongoliensis TaxID=688067 RepID=UPI0009FC4ED9|nr:fatty acid desaturase [Herbidospora mongoliensis]
MWKFPAYVLLLIAAVAFGSNYSGSLEILVKAIALVVGAFSFIGVFGLMHESAHGHLARRGKVNRLIGEALSIVVGTSYTGYRIAHLTHHARFRTERDPQEIIYPRKPKPVTMALLAVAAVIGAPIFLLVRAPFLAFRQKGGVAALRGPLLAVAFYWGWSLLLPAAQWQFLLWTILAGWVLGSMNDIVYHQGLDDDDTLAASTSFDCDVFGQAFLSGANRHAEHHLYPAVPGPRLVAAAEALRGDLQAAGVPYERGFAVAFVRRLIGNPLFLPKSWQRKVGAND